MLTTKLFPFVSYYGLIAHKEMLFTIERDPSNLSKPEVSTIKGILNLLDALTDLLFKEPPRYSFSDHAEMNSFISGIDFSMLFAQQSILADMITKKKFNKIELVTFESILNIVEQIQLAAIEGFGRERSQVLNQVSKVTGKPMVSLEMCRKLVQA